MGGFCPGGFVQGDSVQGDFVPGGALSRGILSGGVCPGDFVLEPKYSNKIDKFCQIAELCEFEVK